MPTVVGVNVDDSGEHFGARVRARREELRLRSRQVTDLDGPPEVTLAKIESGDTKRPSRGTLTALDHALSWAPGSAGRLLSNGEDPISLPARQPGEGRQLLTADPGAPLTAARVVELTRVSHEVDDAAARHPDDDQLSEAAHALNLVTDRFLRTWLIALLESSTDTPGDVPPDPIRDIMLSQYLRRPPGEDLADDDRADVLYVRWLVGQLPEDQLTPSTLALLQMRWAAAQRSRE